MFINSTTSRTKYLVLLLLLKSAFAALDQTVDNVKIAYDSSNAKHIKDKIEKQQNLSEKALIINNSHVKAAINTTEFESPQLMGINVSFY